MKTYTLELSDLVLARAETQCGFVTGSSGVFPSPVTRQ